MIAIAAVSKNWVIGDSKTNKMPWPSQKEDLSFFKQVTTQSKINICICGRKTAESIGDLPNRTILVLSKELYGLTKIDSSMFDFIERNKSSLKSQGFGYYLIGGASIYAQFLNRCSELFLTEFDFEAEGDICFPFGRNELHSMFSNVELVKEIKNGKIWKYER